MALNCLPRPRRNPPPVERMLMPLEPARPTGGGRIAVKLHRRVCLVQTEDALLAEELLARKKLAQDIVGRLNDRVLLIRPGRAEAVLAELVKMGHTPQVASGGGK